MNTMKILSALMLLVSCTANAAVHGDWAVVHRVDQESMKIIHTASTSSTNKLALITIDCDSNIAINEVREYLSLDREDKIKYSIDNNQLNTLTRKASSTSISTYGRIKLKKSAIPTAIETMKQGHTMEYIVTDTSGNDYTYNFSLRGMAGAYDELMEVCAKTRDQ